MVLPEHPVQVEIPWFQAAEVVALHFGAAAVVVGLRMREQVKSEKLLVLAAAAARVVQALVVLEKPAVSLS